MRNKMKKKILFKKLGVLWKIKIWCNRSIQSTNDAIKILTYGQPAKGTSRWVGPRSEPETIEDYQRHLVAMHGIPEGDDGLEPWCDTCGEPIDPGQICLITDEPCRPSVEDLVAMHDDAHADNECYPEHEHAA